jgi:hypothetical protein
MNLNDTLLPVTPSMERFTVQANAFTVACSFLPKRDLPKRGENNVPVFFTVFLNEWMAKNDHDELGDFWELVDFAVTCCKR